MRPRGRRRPASRAPMIWYVSCPLPAITIVSPVLAQASAASIASRRSGSSLRALGRAGDPPHAHEDLVDDRLGSLGPRVVGGRPRPVGRARGDLAHDRALGPVAITAAAEHHAQPAGRDLARGGQHALERVRRVRVVHHHQERLSRAHLLEASGHRADRTERTRDGRGLQAQRQAGGDRAEQVHDVVLAHQRRDEAQGTARRLDPHADPVEGGGVLHGAHLGAGAQTEGQHRQVEAADHLGTGRIVGAHDGGPPGLGRGGEQLEQSPLGPAVFLERAVKVEVILGEVGEHRHVELQLVHPVERQRVRGHLHRHAADPGGTHLGQHRLELQRLRRRLIGHAGLGADHVLDRADDSGAQPPRAQERVHQVRRGGLAVGAGDPHQRERGRRMPVERPGQASQRPARRGHEHLGDAQAAQRISLGHHQPRAAGHRVGHEAPGVLLEAGNRDEAIAGLDATRVGGQAAHDGRRLADQPALRQRFEQDTHRHVMPRHVISRRRSPGSAARRSRPAARRRARAPAPRRARARPP